MKRIRVAGYAKLAKYWEKRQDEAVAFHRTYFQNRFSDENQFCFVHSFVDITGAKEIRKRPQMLRLLDFCASGQVDLIFAQTKGYLAANTDEFCFLIRFLSEISPDVALQTEDSDYHIDTLVNEDYQREELLKMADSFCIVNADRYREWKKQVLKGITRQREMVENGNGSL